MTELREPPTTDKQPPGDAEAPVQQSLLYRLRHSLRKRFPRLFHHSDSARRLDVWRERDPVDNVKTTPPADEFVDLRCLWAVEFYTPAYVDALLAGFQSLGWGKGDGSSLQDPVAWVQRLNEHPYGSGWLNLGVIQPPNTDTFFLPPCRKAPLPAGVHYATGELHSFTSSLTCIVMGFMFEEKFSRQFDEALRAKRQTYTKPLRRGYQICGPEEQKTDHIRQIRAEIGDLAAVWFRQNLPGLFSSGLLGGEQPTCEFVTLRGAEPFPSHSEGNIRPPAYISILDLASSFDAWQSADMPGLKFSVLRRNERDPRYHSILATKESDFDDEKITSWGGSGRTGQISYIDEIFTSLLSRRAILTLLEGYSWHLDAMRDAATSRPGARQKRPLEVLHIFGKHISYSVDIAAVTAELIPYAQERTLFGHGVETFEPCDDRHYGDGFTLVKGLRLEIEKRATWLQKTDQSLRDHLTQYGSLLGAKENIRVQKKLSVLTVIVIFLTLAMLWTAAADSETVLRLLQWVRGFWANPYS